MSRESEGPDRLLATTTHARLRAEQGDVGTAREILLEVLERDPGDERAQELLRRLPGAEGEPDREAALGRREAIERLETWLRRVRAVNGERDV